MVSATICGEGVLSNAGEEATTAGSAKGSSQGEDVLCASHGEDVGCVSDEALVCTQVFGVEDDEGQGSSDMHCERG